MTFTARRNVRSVAIRKRKGNVHPGTGHENSEGEMYNFTLSLTSALGWGGWSTPRSGCFTLDRVATGRLSGPEGRSGRVREISPPLEFDPRTFQTVVSRYTD
jgi:hypothetical protein